MRKIVLFILLFSPFFLFAQPKLAWWKAIRFTRVPMEDTISVKVPCVAVDADNIIWTGRGKWLCGWDDLKQLWSYFKIGDGIVSIDIDKDGMFWLATDTRKIIQYDTKKKSKTSFFVKELSSSAIIHKIWIDGSNNKWLCTSEGLIKFTNNVQTGYGKVEVMPDLKNIEVLRIQKHKGVLKAATTQGIYQYNGTSWSPILAYYKKEIWGMDVNGGDEVFIAYNSGKVDFVWNENTKIGQDSTKRFRFNDVFADDYGRFWGATLGGVQGWADAFGYWHYFNDINSDLNISVAYQVIQDNKGGIWVGAEEGLYKIIEPRTKTETVGLTPAPSTGSPIPLTPPSTIPLDTLSMVSGLSQIHLVLVLDISGSMETSINRMSVAFHNILKYLRADDKITIVTYASKVDVEAVNWSVDKQSKAKIQELFNGFAYRGGTNIKAALSKAGQLSRKYKISGGNNRIIIVSDANFDVRGRMSDVSSIASNGIKVSVFCSQKKTPDQHKDLTELAKRGRGTYFNFAVGNSKSIEEAFWQELLGF